MLQIFLQSCQFLLVESVSLAGNLFGPLAFLLLHPQIMAQHLTLLLQLLLVVFKVGDFDHVLLGDVKNSIFFLIELTCDSLNVLLFLSNGVIQPFALFLESSTEVLELLILDEQFLLPLFLYFLQLTSMQPL